MGWIRGRYYVRSAKRNGRVIHKYIGGGELGKLAAAEDAGRRAEWESQAAAWRAGIAKAKAEGKTWGGRRPGTRIKLTEEKEMVIHQFHSEGKPVRHRTDGGADEEDGV